MVQHNDGRWSHKPGSGPTILLEIGKILVPKMFGINDIIVKLFIWQ